MKKAEAAPAKEQSGNFESSLVALERIVRELEQGDLPLERSLELFEQGVRLSRECQERLNEAERRVELLLRDPEGRPMLSRLGTDELSDEEEGDAEEDESVF